MRTLLGGLTAALLALTGTTVAQAVDQPEVTAGPVRSAVNLTGPAYGSFGAHAQLTGTLWRYQTSVRIAGATVVLQRSVHGRNSWSAATSTRTAANGSYAFTVSLAGAYDYRTVYAGSSVYTSAVSGVINPRVLQKVILDTVRTTNRSVENTNLGTLQAIGRVYPTPPAGARIWLQRWDGKTWRNYMSTVARGGSSSIVITGNVPPNVSTFRLYAPLRYPYYAGASNSKAFSHYVWRGVFTKPSLGVGGSARAGRYLLRLWEDHLRQRINLWAENGGRSFVEVNTTGCLQIDPYMQNVSDLTGTATRIEASTRRGDTALRAVTLQPGEAAGVPINLAGLTRTRIQARALDSGEPTSSWSIAALCNN